MARIGDRPRPAPRASTARVAASASGPSPQATATWFSTTSFSTAIPGSAASRAAIARATAQCRSTISATPCRPSAISTAQTAKPRARRDISGEKASGARFSPLGR